MMITVLSSVSKMERVNFMINGGYDSGLVRRVEGDAVTISYVQKNLGRKGEWIISKRNAKRRLSKGEVFSIS